MADFYIRSATSLDRVLRDECSVKAAAAPHPDAGRVLAILVNSLAYRSSLMLALEESRVLKLEEKVFTLTPSPPKAKAKGKAKQEPKKSKKDSKLYPSKEAFLLVLCHDLLFQSRGIQAAKTWPPKVTLERYKPSLHSSLVKLQIRQGKSRIQDLRSGALYQEMTARIPRWIRINSLRATRDEVFAWLAENRYTQVEAEELNGVREFAESKHVPGLLAFHPKATSGLLGSEMYKGNWIVMQDLASCFPAYILDPPADAEVIDATSAPGNKTSHLSTIMYTKRSSPSSEDEAERPGKVYAFERDAVRYKTLVKRLTAVGALSSPQATLRASTGNVLAERKDFLTTQPASFSGVTHMLLDPSCSGSGIVNRLDFLKEDDDVENTNAGNDDDDDDDDDDTAASTGAREDAADGVKLTKLERRLHQLGEFQLLMIRHAFKFPSLQKVVYSTCSIHAQENEKVVIRALATEEARQHGWTLAPRRDVIPSWPVRGDTTACKNAGNEQVADAVIRCVPGGTGDGDKPNTQSCNGFFVACFVKADSSADADIPQDDGKSKRPREAEDEHDEDHNETEDGADKETGKKLSGGSNSAANRKKKLQKRRKKQRLQQENP